MDWRKLSRVVWPSAAGIVGGVLSVFVYAAVVVPLLNRFYGEDDRSPTAIAIGVTVSLGSFVAFFVGLCLASKWVAGWFDSID